MAVCDSLKIERKELQLQKFRQIRHPRRGMAPQGLHVIIRKIDFTLSGFMCLPFIFRFVLIVETVYFQTLSSIVSCFIQSNLKFGMLLKLSKTFI